MPKKNTVIEIRPPNVETVLVKIVGDTPLIVHQFAEKSKKEMRDKQAKKAKKKRDIRDPDKEYEQAKYKLPNGKDGFPALAIKQAIVGSARFVDDLPMTILRGTVFVMTDDMESGLVAIKCKKEKMVEDIVRVGMGSSDFRYRPYYYDWSIDLRIKYDKDVLSLEQLLNLLTRAGLSQGLGDWRPERDGQNGQFHVSAEKIKVL